MKKLVVCTDFSPCSDKALDYAVHLARENGAEIVLLNCFFIANSPSITSPYRGVMDDVISETERQIVSQAKERLKKYEHTFYLDSEVAVKITPMAKNGITEEIIIEIAAAEKADMLVLGAKGANAISRLFLGSVTSSILSEKLPCPLLAVPEDAQYEGIKKIVFASRFDESEFKVIDQLLEFATEFEAEITCLNVSSPDGKADETKLRERYFFTPLSLMNYKQIPSAKVEKALDDYLQDSSADVLAMLTRERSFVEQVFTHSHTRKMLFHTKTPMLIYKQ
jgi:nucleotide-binding universal stress UspA family protein